MEMVSLNATHADSRRLSRHNIASIALHVLIVALLAYQFHRAAVVRPQPHKAAYVLVPYAPGRAPVVQPPRPKIVPPKEIPRIAVKQPEPPPPSTGGDPSGESDVTVAMADFFPDPKPDLSQLPHGTKGDVLIDIVIDEGGKVVEAQLDQGLGHGVDQAVIAVVETWTFTPATKAGKPVASKQQLLFHFERT